MILAAGLSPALQQVLVLDGFVPGEVNRAREVYWCASGKVLNVARALHTLGAAARAITVTGGNTGEAVRRDCADHGIAGRWLNSAQPTRVCTTILVRGQPSATELVPNAPVLTAAELEAFQHAYAEEAAAAKLAVLIGSLPAGTPGTFYRDLIARTPGRVILDARGPELIAALPEKPFLVKPNRQELGRTMGRDLMHDADLFAALEGVNGLGAEWVLVTDGPRPGYARSAARLYRLQAPPVPVVNPIGCGDCMAAGIAWALYQGREMVEALRYGLAVAAVKAGRLLPGDVDGAQIKTMLSKVDITPL